MPSSRELEPLHWGFPRLLFHNQFRSKPVYAPKSTDLSGKTAIITGANVGLGFESARQLLGFRLSHLIIAVRSTSKGEAAASGLRQKFPKAEIEVWTVDMLSYESIQSFAHRAQKELRRLDIAILNAGIASNNFRLAATGHEEIVQVNYLSTVLLATLLLPIAKEKKPPTGQPGIVTIVNSGLALVAGFKNRNANPLLPSFDDRKNFSPTDTYSTSKTLAHLWLWKAAEYISADDVVLSMVDPAYIKGTSLQRDQAAILRPIVWPFERLAGKTVAVGASNYVDAVVNKGKESHGCFLMNWEITP